MRNKTWELVLFSIESEFNNLNGAHTMKFQASLTCLVAALAIFSQSALAETKMTKKEESNPTTANKVEVQHITVTNKLIDGKKTWLPAEINVKVGHKVELELVNTLPEPHGFNVPGLAENVVVGGNTKQTVSFTPSKKEKIKFNCQLHPAHVGGHVNIQ